ncbi:MAG TPA: MarR family transcriptional regulator [Burkholderiaceae bacterium]|jgi:DNA-binding MarR family transcriptional regulator|nr:MarR family transcriptional regulator [Burkholderiaceae bacterium]
MSTIRSPAVVKDKPTAAPVRLRKADYERLAAFRTTLRRFLSFSEAAARGIGLASQQYQALLAVKGYPGRDAITINELAQQLLIKHNSAVGLVDRLEAEGLVRRQPAVGDRRKVDVRLTPKGTRLFERLAATHHAELARIGPQLRDFFEYVSDPAGKAPVASARRAAGGSSGRPRALSGLARTP